MLRNKQKGGSVLILLGCLLLLSLVVSAFGFGGNGYYDRETDQCWSDENHPVGTQYPSNESIPEFYHCCLNGAGEQIDCNNSSIVLYPEETQKYSAEITVHYYRDGVEVFSNENQTGSNQSTNNSPQVQQNSNIQNNPVQRNTQSHSSHSSPNHKKSNKTVVENNPETTRESKVISLPEITLKKGQPSWNPVKKLIDFIGNLFGKD